jgi:hypothetical protein
MWREKFISIGGILVGHKSDYEKHTYRKNVRWIDKCPEDPKNNKWMCRRMYLQADQTKENVGKPTDRHP